MLASLAGALGASAPLCTATVPDPARTAPLLGPFEGGSVATHARFLFEANPPFKWAFAQERSTRSASRSFEAE